MAVRSMGRITMMMRVRGVIWEVGMANRVWNVGAVIVVIFVMVIRLKVGVAGMGLGRSPLGLVGWRPHSTQFGRPVK